MEKAVLLGLVLLLWAAAPGVANLSPGDRNNLGHVWTAQTVHHCAPAGSCQARAGGVGAAADARPVAAAPQAEADGLRAFRLSTPLALPPSGTQLWSGAPCMWCPGWLLRSSHSLAAAEWPLFIL